ncbi:MULTISPECIES: hypothetical protein [unclassified Lactobacillus]|uniref:hypothetical protein n=1 Tax=unclassified Lactobacillus TaxID=2620435 RepID=UPI000EFD4185|nr:MULTISPECIES: hypothetical protein [unclassified Lactobacillus]RMC43011.1 hypothetical protein F5ESL0234_06950 [Lactobacillus sp. ESL0234]RMC44866.1 hypothetical protein F5ESL0230_07755 [Lactobacillus sp. ESL0230]RMC38666.1 hypothetical protein F5ESL0237_06945 [Lactobacillus sp. ESL0237]RMC43865.1 hypothetical protein F5ESL0236_06955 [Lactobacillus sp. ESL0236]RMC48113.1 hypothetical protein F5ESL0225_07300 [Lactobacillus sp. ESL0225]
MISNINNYILIFLNKSNLNAKRILTLYIDALLLIPLCFGSFLFFELTIMKQNMPVILAKFPIISIEIIIAITDFLLGYYLWLKKDELIANPKNYHFFMLCQAVSQLMVGNILCLILAIFGLLRISSFKEKYQAENKLIKNISVICLIAFSLCFVLFICLDIKNSRY